MPQMTGCMNKFDNNKIVSLMIKEIQLLKKL